jgi:hypothetical protein
MTMFEEVHRVELDLLAQLALHGSRLERSSSGRDGGDDVLDGEGDLFVGSWGVVSAGSGTVGQLRRRRPS